MLTDKVLGAMLEGLGASDGGLKKWEGMVWLCDGGREMLRAG